MDATEAMIIELERKLAHTDRELVRVRATLDVLVPQLTSLAASVSQLNRLADRGQGSLLVIALICSGLGAVAMNVLSSIWQKFLSP
jgi:hypothetical protein